MNLLPFAEQPEVDVTNAKSSSNTDLPELILFVAHQTQNVRIDFICCTSNRKMPVVTGKIIPLRTMTYSSLAPKTASKSYWKKLIKRR